MEFLVHISAGMPMNKEHFARCIAALKDGQYIIKITRHGTRSLDQNAYFHGVVVPIVMKGLREIGWDEIEDTEDAKDLVKRLFLTRRMTNKITGEMEEKILKTSKLSTLEFHEFIEAIIKWGVEYLGIQIPHPNERIRNYNPDK